MYPPTTAAQVRELLATCASISLPSSAEVQARPDAEHFLDTLVEIAFLASQGDHRLTGHEMQCLSGILTELSAGTIDASALAGMVYEFSSVLERDGLDMRISAIVDHIHDREDALCLLVLGALVAMCDRALQPGEREILRAMAVRMGVPLEEMDPRIDALYKRIYEAS